MSKSNAKCSQIANIDRRVLTQCDSKIMSSAYTRHYLPCSNQVQIAAVC